MVDVGDNPADGLPTSLSREECQGTVSHEQRIPPRAQQSPEIRPHERYEVGIGSVAMEGDGEERVEVALYQLDLVHDVTLAGTPLTASLVLGRLGLGLTTVRRLCFVVATHRDTADRVRRPGPRMCELREAGEPP